MAFNLDAINRKDIRIGYFPYTTGIDIDGNECTMVVEYNSSAGYYYWSPSQNGCYGYEFTSQDIAKDSTLSAVCCWSVTSVDNDNIKIGVVGFTVVRTAVNMGDVA